LISWVAFRHNDIDYTLDHLHPYGIVYIEPAKAGKAEKEFRVDISYGLHCFTRGLDLGVSELNYQDVRETRTFDFKRYELSKLLPGIIQDLHTRRCMHTGHGNFFVIEVIAASGVKENYEVYFEVKRSKTKGVAHLYLQTAYVRDVGVSKSTQKISLFVILYNKITGKEIKIQK
jgi:hypothetical protein